VINTEILNNLNVLKFFATYSYTIVFTIDGIFAVGESQENFFSIYHHLTKINFFNIRIKNIVSYSFINLFISYKNEVFGFFDNYLGKRESYIKDPITVKFKCNGKIFDKDSCGINFIFFFLKI
jgi:hypothetical protein